MSGPRLRAKWPASCRCVSGLVFAALRRRRREPVLPQRLPATPSSSKAWEQPTAVRFSPDGRVFVAEKTGRILVFEQPRGQNPGTVQGPPDRGLRPRPTAGCSVSPSTRNSRPALRLRALHLRPVLGARRTGAANGANRTRPATNVQAAEARRRRLPRQRPAGPLHRRRHRKPRQLHAVAGEEKALIRRLVPAVLLALDRRPALRPRRRALRQRWRRRQLHQPDYGQFGWPQPNQCGDPTEGGGELSPARCGGRGAARAGPAHADDPSGPRRHDHPHRSRNRRRLPDNPKFGSIDRNEQRIVAYGFRNPFRFTIDRDDRHVYVANVGWLAAIEEIDRFAPPPRQPLNSGWPCYEGPGASLSSRTSNCRSAKASTRNRSRRRRRGRTVLRTTATRSR